MSADKNPMVRRLICSEVLDIGIARVRPSHDLPVRHDLVGAFDDGPRPTQFLCAPDVQTARMQHDTSRLNLLNRHPRIAWFHAVFVLELDQMDKIRVCEADPIFSRIDKRPVAKILTVPAKEVQQRR